MLDQSRSGRREAQKKLQEDIMLRVLAFLNEGLSLGNLPDLRVGCYMIMIVLASKTNLDDATLSAMMESIVWEWKGSTHTGLICLAVLAQQKKNAILPRKVFKALIAVERLGDDLMFLKRRYKVDNLVLGVLLGMVDGIERAPDAKLLCTFRSLVEAELMDDLYITIATKAMLSTVQRLDPQADQDFDLRGSLGDLILRLADSNVIGEVVQQVIRDSTVDIDQLGTGLQRATRPPKDRSELPAKDLEMKDVDERPTLETFGMVLSRIPTRTAYEISFLSHSESYVFPSLAHAFLLASSSPKDISTFSDLTVLRRSFAMTEPLFVSFFARIWCGNYPATVRSAAIGVISEYLEREKLAADVQVLLPYIIYALADGSVKVRRASADLVLVLAAAYENFLSPGQQNPKPNILGEAEIYGQGKEAREVSWMNTAETAKFIQDVLVSSLEECMIDASHMLSCLTDSLRGSKPVKAPKNGHKELKTSLRAAVFSCLSSHVVNTPLYAVKYRLLHMLNRVAKVGSVSRTKVLLPLLEKSITQSQNELEESCKDQHFNPGQLVEQIIGIVTPSDRDGMHIIQIVIQSKNQSMSPLFYTAVLKHIQDIWASLKADNQSSLANMLLDLAISGPETGYGDLQQSEASDTLRSVDLPTTILLSFLEELPPLSIGSAERSSAIKRRRTSHSHTQSSAADDPSVLAQSFRRMTFVLELIEASKPERHPELLKGLFKLAGDIQHSIHSTGTVLNYLQVLTLSNSLAILDDLRVSYF